jgi:hypothetical protein
MEERIEKYYFVALIVFLVFLTGTMMGVAGNVPTMTAKAADGWVQTAPTDAPAAPVGGKKLAQK